MEDRLGGVPNTGHSERGSSVSIYMMRWETRMCSCSPSVQGESPVLPFPSYRQRCGPGLVFPSPCTPFLPPHILSVRPSFSGGLLVCGVQLETLGSSSVTPHTSGISQQINSASLLGKLCWSF